MKFNPSAIPYRNNGNEGGRGPALDRGGSSVCQDAELRNPSWAVIKSPTELFCRGGENDLLREHGDFMKCRSIAVSNGGADLEMVREGGSK
jgi:hypothetical protein